MFKKSKSDEELVANYVQSSVGKGLQREVVKKLMMSPKALKTLRKNRGK